MRLTRHASAALLLADARPALAADVAAEARHSLLIGAALARAREEADSAGSAESGAAAETYYATVRTAAGEVVLVAYRAAPYPLVLAAPGPRDGVTAALDLLLRDLDAAGHRPGALTAPTALADAFVARWSLGPGRGARLAMRQRVHALDAVRDVPAPPGGMRRAEAADLPLVEAWMNAFNIETIGDADDVHIRVAAGRRVAAGEVWLWDDADGRTRAIAAAARPTGRTVTVNGVYTPPDARGGGRATALVAALSRRLLADGFDACVLYTDLANPTSNAIYARIGYRPVEDCLLYRLDRLD